MRRPARARVRVRWVLPPVVALALSLIGSISGSTPGTDHARSWGALVGGYAARAAQIDAQLDALWCRDRGEPFTSGSCPSPGRGADTAQPAFIGPDPRPR